MFAALKWNQFGWKRLRGVGKRKVVKTEVIKEFDYSIRNPLSRQESFSYRLDNPLFNERYYDINIYNALYSIRDMLIDIKNNVIGLSVKEFGIRQKLSHNRLTRLIKLI